MEKTCNLLERLLQAVDVFGVPPIPYLGLASQRFYNPPAPHLELCLLVEGECPDLRIGDEPHPLTKGQLSLHNVHHGNYSSGHPEMRGWCLFFDIQELAVLEDLAAEPVAHKLAVAEMAAVEDAFERLAALCYEAGRPVGYFDVQHLYQQQDTASRPALGYRLKAAVLELLGLLLTESGAAESSPPHLPDAVRQTLREISLHYQDTNLGLPDLARTAGLSPNHLGRLFRQHVGQPPMQYLQELRLEQARHLLRHTDLRINEIAWQIGWRDPLYFSRIFHRETGCSPSKYRREHAER